MSNPEQDASWLARLEELSSNLVAPGSRVWKDECAFTFETPESADSGLFLNLSTFQAFSSEMTKIDHARTGNVLYMYIKWSREEEDQKKKTTQQDEEESPSKLAIGVEGGFSPADAIGGKGKLVKEYGFVLYPDLEYILPYPCNSVKLSTKLIQVADQVIASDDASAQMELQAWDAEAEPRPESKFARTLEQLDNGVKISSDPKTWKCAESGMTENLWLNLSTGYIGSGRRNWDGTGGTGAALAHFEATGSKYPLCVKLGTITPDGKADVYSYDPSEDCLVTDPLLEKHLRHWGINIMDLKKTEKTMLEMEIDLNKSLSFSAVLENGEELVDCHGPGNVGLFNLGNSCYANSVYQILFSLMAFQDRYLYGEGEAMQEQRLEVFREAPEEPQSDLSTQLTKLAAALSDPFGSGLKRTDEGILAIPPKMLKDTLGKGHPDFSGREQQDSREYFQHVLDRIERADHKVKEDKGGNPGKWFSFLLEERLVCKQTDMVQYKNQISNVLLLNIPFTLKDQEEYEAKCKQAKGDKLPEAPSIPFEECLYNSLGEAAAEQVDDYLSPATQTRGVAEKSTKLASFPKYLAVQMKRYVLGENWVPKKLECRVPVPRSIDLTEFKGNGISPGEKPLPESSEGGAHVPDPDLLAQLMAMGFGENGCKRALLAVKNAGTEQAMEWVLQHMEDADFNDPPPAQGGGSSGADPEQVMMLSSMGFSEEAAGHALKECSGNLERAADWLFSHASELESILKNASAPSVKKEDLIMEQNDADSGEYVLRGFISHIGKTTTGGHYLCHINRSEDLRDKSKDEWVICNDRKVARSKQPPFEYGFMYFFERVH